MFDKKAYKSHILDRLNLVLQDRAESAGSLGIVGISGVTKMHLLLDVLLTDNWEMTARRVALATQHARPDITSTSQLMQHFLQDCWVRNRTRCQHFVRRLHGDEGGLDLLWLMLAAAPGKSWTYVGWIDRLTAAVNEMTNRLSAIEEGLLPRVLERYQRWVDIAAGFPAIEDDPFAAVSDRGWRRAEAALKDRERSDRAAAAEAAVAAERNHANRTRNNAIRQPFKSVRELVTADEEDVGAVRGNRNVPNPTFVVQILPPSFKATGVWRGLTESRTCLVTSPAIQPVRDLLRAEYPHAHGAIDTMLLDLRQDDAIEFRPFVLVGSAGCGKSRLVRRFGELLDIKVCRYDGAGSSDNAFAGTPKRWHSASPCFPLLAIANNGVANPIVLIDEVDKAGAGFTAGSLTQALMPFLERETSARYPDPCLEVEGNLRYVNYVLTANDDSRLPSPLRDRIRIIRVPSPGVEHIESLSRSILKDMAAELNLPVAFMAPLAPDELTVVARMWGNNGSVRKLQRSSAAP